FFHTAPGSSSPPPVLPATPGDRPPAHRASPVEQDPAFRSGASTSRRTISASFTVSTNWATTPQHFTAAITTSRADHPVRLHLLDHTCRPRIPDPQATLDQRSGGLARRQHQVLRLFVHLVLRLFLLSLLHLEGLQFPAVRRQGLFLDKLH